MGTVIYKTDDLPKGEQFEYWNDAICNVFTDLECHKSPVDHNANSAAYFGELNAWDLEQVRVSTVSCEPCDVHHSRWHVSKATEEVFLLHLQLRGQSLNAQNGNEAFLNPGEFTLCSSTSPYSVSFNNSIDMMVVRIPYTVLSQYFAAPENLVGLKFDKTQGLNQVFTDYLLGIWQQRDCVSNDNHQMTMSDVALSLLSTTFDMRQASGQASPSAVRITHMQRIKRYIDRYLNDSLLTPELIAKANNVSSRYLRMLFAEEGTTCSRYLIQRRIEQVARHLAAPNSRHNKIVDIAYQWGFNNPSHFSRVFKAHFQQTPQEYRQSHVR